MKKSVFIEKATVKQTGRAVPYLDATVELTDDFKSSKFEGTDINTYRLQAIAAIDFACPATVYKYAEENAIIQMNEFIYGNIRRKLYEAKNITYSGDLHKAIECLDEILELIDI